MRLLAALVVGAGRLEDHLEIRGAAREHAPHVARLLAAQAREGRVGEEDVRVVAAGHRLGVAGGEGGVEVADELLVRVHGRALS